MAQAGLLHATIMRSYKVSSIVGRPISYYRLYLCTPGFGGARVLHATIMRSYKESSIVGRPISYYRQYLCTQGFGGASRNPACNHYEEL